MSESVGRWGFGENSPKLNAENLLYHLQELQKLLLHLCSTHKSHEKHELVGSLHLTCEILERTLMELEQVKNSLPKDAQATLAQLTQMIPEMSRREDIGRLIHCAEELVKQLDQ